MANISDESIMGIKLDNVSVRIKEKEIIKNVTFLIKSGEVLSIVGPNGSGKSTLLKAIVGDIPVDKGLITYKGKPIKQISNKERADIRSVMSQSPTISYDFTVMDIIEMGLFNNEKRLNRKNFNSTIKMIVSDCELSFLTHRKFNSLSGGEQRRVHLARTLIQLYDGNKTSNFKDKYMFFDEPTANLDIAYEIGMLKVIQKRAADGFGVFITLHNLEMAYKFSHKIGIMHKGELVQFGNPELVYENSLLSEVYGIKIEFDKKTKKLNYR